MPSSSRSIVDMWVGICCCHEDEDEECIPMTGPIILGSPNNRSGNFSQARLAALTIGLCGHPGFIVSASSKTVSNSLGKARIGSAVAGCNIGLVITGLGTHEVGG